MTDNENVSSTTEKTVKGTQKAPKVVAEKDRRNGVTRPKGDTVTGSIWVKADAISAKSGVPCTRAQITEACSKLNQSTVATQYGKWCRYYGIKKEPAIKAPKPPKTEPVSSDGPALGVPSEDDDISVVEEV